MNSLKTLADLFLSGEWRTNQLTTVLAAVDVIKMAAGLFLKDGPAKEGPMLMVSVPSDEEATALLTQVKDAFEATPDGAEPILQGELIRQIATWIAKSFLNRLLDG